MADAPAPQDFSKDIYALGRQLADIQGQLDFMKTERGLIATSVQADINNSSAFSVGAYGEALFQTFKVPRGYSQCYILLFCSAGQTLASGTGNVGVWPVVDSIYAGPAVANGSPGAGPVSSSSFYAVLRNNLAPGSSLRLAAWVANQGTLTPNSANVHLSASLLFLR